MKQTLKIMYADYEVYFSKYMDLFLFQFYKFIYNLSNKMLSFFKYIRKISSKKMDNYVLKIIER